MVLKSYHTYESFMRCQGPLADGHLHFLISSRNRSPVGLKLASGCFGGRMVAEFHDLDGGNTARLSGVLDVGVEVFHPEKRANSHRSCGRVDHNWMKLASSAARTKSIPRESLYGEIRLNSRRRFYTAKPRDDTRLPLARASSTALRIRSEAKPYWTAEMWKSSSQLRMAPAP